MTEIQKLYAQIPGNTCKPGCHACCINSIQMSREERERMGGYPYVDKCPHIVPEGCSAYPNRAFLCRLYGVSELFPCDDCVPERLLTAQETMELVHRYLELCRQSDGLPDNSPDAALSVDLSLPDTL